MANLWSRWRHCSVIPAEGRVVAQDMEAIPETSGLYQVGLVDAQQQPICIPRFLREDNEGTLYLGSAGDLRARISSLRSGSHRFRHMYRWYAPQLVRRFPAHSMRYRVRRAHGEDPKHLEAKDLAEYRYHFGDLPPFNLQPPRLP